MIYLILIIIIIIVIVVLGMIIMYQHEIWKDQVKKIEDLKEKLIKSNAIYNSVKGDNRVLRQKLKEVGK